MHGISAFGEDFDQIFGQGLDQAAGDGTNHKYSVQYCLALRKKYFKPQKALKTSKTITPINPLRYF